MKKVIKKVLIIYSVIIVLAMIAVSFLKMQQMILVNTNPNIFKPGSIELHYKFNQPLAYLHIVFGLIILITGAYQFIPALRNKFRKLHKSVGKIFLFSSFIVSISAIILALFFRYGNILESTSTLIFGLFILYGTIKAYQYAKQKNFIAHKKWVTRVYFVSLSIGTIRIIAALLMATSQFSLKDVLGISFLIAFCVHFIVVELWIKYLSTTEA